MVKLLLLIDCDEVEVFVVVSTVIPWSVPELPEVSAIVLLLIVCVNVPVGALEKDGTKIPRRVPEVVPPTELVIELREIL